MGWEYKEKLCQDEKKKSRPERESWSREAEYIKMSSDHVHVQEGSMELVGLGIIMDEESAGSEPSTVP